MKRLLILTIIGLGAVTLAAADDPTRPGSPIQRPTQPIVNTVLDLLDHDVTLATGTPGHVWESQVFDASQATRIGLRIDGAMIGAAITCSTSWQFTREDAFRDSGPSDSIGRPPRTTYTGYPGLASFRSRLQYPAPSYVYLAPEPFSPVFGLRAKIVCSAGPLFLPGFGDFQILGDDLTLPGPRGGGVLDEEAPVVGTLTDVKVLLRRE